MQCSHYTAQHEKLYFSTSLKSNTCRYRCEVTVNNDVLVTIMQRTWAIVWNAWKHVLSIVNGKWNIAIHINIFNVNSKLFTIRMTLFPGGRKLCIKTKFGWHWVVSEQLSECAILLCFSYFYSDLQSQIFVLFYSVTKTFNNIK